MTPLEAAKAEAARRQAVAGAQAELARRQSAQPQQQADPRQAMLDRIAAAKAGTLQASPESLASAAAANRIASPSVPTPDTAQIQSQIDTSRGRDETAAALLNKAGESLTLGLVGDEAAAGADSLIGRGGGYDERLQFYRDQEARVNESNPGLAMAADIGGALLGPGKLAAPIAGVRGAIAAAGASSAIEGFFEGEGGVESRAKSGAISGAVGMFGGGLLAVASKGARGALTSAFKKAGERPSIETLRSAKNVAYAEVRRSGVKFSGDEMAGLSRRLQRLSKTARWDIDDELDEGAIRALRALERRSGKDLTINNLDKVRQRLWDVYKKSDEPFVLEAIAEIDSLVSKKAVGNELIGMAREANSRFAKAQLLENAFKKARLQTASTGSGGNILNKYRQAVTRIVTNQNEARWFSADEIAVMESFIEGSNSENVLRRIGKIGPGGNGLMTALNVYAATVDPALLTVSAIGAGAKSAADRSAMKGSERILDSVASGIIQQPQAVAPIGRAAVGAGAALNSLLD